jgi:ribokinase
VTLQVPDRRRAAPSIVAAGSATRDLDPADGRGWRLGGAAAYSALAAARLGARVSCILGVDASVERAVEIDLLRAAGIDLHLARIASVPVFENIEGQAGRYQRMVQAGARMAVPGGTVDPRPTAWLLAPVAGELDESWLAAAADGLLALGVQGWLRGVATDGTIRANGQLPAALLGRADIVAVSEEDVPGTMGIPALRGLAKPGGTTLLTLGARGGLAILGGRLLEWPAIRSASVVDPTGAGDVFLGAYLAVRLALGRRGERRALRMAAAAASCKVEARGLAGVPNLPAIRDRARERR